MSDYKTDREWSDRYIPAIREIVGPMLLVPSSDLIDKTQAADLIILKARDMTVAARIRRPGYFDKYPFDFTIRSQRDSGAETEITKIINGFGDWMLYGHAAESNDSIAKWMLIDLDALRASLIRNPYGRSRLESQQSNRDGTHFVAFDVSKFRRGGDSPLLIASNYPIPNWKDRCVDHIAA